MKPCQQMELLMLDRTVLDTAYEINKKNKPIRPEYFLNKINNIYTF